MIFVIRASAVTLAFSLVLSLNEGGIAQVPSPNGGAQTGTTVEFHGWSPDSQYLAYTRTKRTVPRGRRGKVRMNRRSHHRRVKAGRFQGTGPVSPDQHIPRYAERKGYVVADLERLEVSDAETWFVALEGTYKLRLVVGDVMAWELRFEDELIARRAFDAIYVKCDARIYPSPDRRQLLLVMHLDRGWTSEAAVYPMTLPKTVTQAWSDLQGAAGR